MSPIKRRKLVMAKPGSAKAQPPAGTASALAKALKLIEATVGKQEGRLQAIEVKERIATAGMDLLTTVDGSFKTLTNDLNNHAAQLLKNHENLDEVLSTQLNASDQKFKLCDGILGEMRQLMAGSAAAVTSPGVPSPLVFSQDDHTQRETKFEIP